MPNGVLPMPTRLVQDAKCIYTLERSILPFLAPATLQPWPSIAFRHNSHSQAALRSESSPEAIYLNLGSISKESSRFVADQKVVWEPSTLKPLDRVRLPVDLSAGTANGQQAILTSSSNVPCTVRKIPFPTVPGHEDHPDQGTRELRVPPNPKRSLGRHRMVSILSNSADEKWGHQCLAWSKAYKRLDTSRFTSTYKRNTAHDLDKAISNGTVAQQLKRRLERGLSPKETWEKLDEVGRRRLWQPLMLWALRNAPQQSLQLIRSTYEEPFPWAHAVADSIDYITNYLLGTASPRSDCITTVEDILSTLSVVLGRHSGPTFPIQQRTIFLLISNGNYDQILQLYRLIDANSIQLHEDTVLHFLSSMTRHGNIDLAKSLVGLLVQHGTDLNSKKLLKACTSFFRNFMGRENKPVGAEVLSLLVAKGFKPNINVYNVLISSACKSNQHSSTEKLLFLMKTLGIQPDAYTHSIILNNAKLGQQEDFQKALASFQRSELPQDNPYVVTDILHSMLLSAASDPSSIGPFDAMLAKFKTVWNTQVLEDLGIILSGHSGGDIKVLTQDKSPNPPVPALSVMLSAFLDTCKDDVRILKTYQRFRELVESGHPQIAQLVKTDFVPNAFLARFRRGRMDLDLCISVPETMMKQLPTEIDSRPTIQAPPTIQTWSILIAAFLDRGLVTAVDVVMRILKHHGLVPTKATWNTMISGLSELQRVEDTAKVVQKMRDAGHVLDHKNLRSLKKIRDREGLLKALANIQHKDTAQWPRNFEGLGVQEWKSSFVNSESAIPTTGVRYVSSKHL